MKRFEAMEGIPSGRTGSLMNIQNKLESAGILFVGTSDLNPGVQLDLKKHQAYLESQ